METDAGELVPPGPVATRVTLKFPRRLGAPEIAPVAESMASPGGRPVADQPVAGRFAASSRLKVLLKAVPNLPVEDWAPGM